MKDNNNNAVYYNLAKDFALRPGPRYKRLGQHSGEEFRKKYLAKWIDDAKTEGKMVVIVLDGVYTLPVSFMEEAFGGMQRVLNDTEPGTHLAKYVDWISNTDPLDVEDVRHYVQKAFDKANKKDLKSA